MSKENKMTKLEAYNEAVSAIRRAEYVDSAYAIKTHLAKRESKGKKDE